jgi:hypothetical protein
MEEDEKKDEVIKEVEKIVEVPVEVIKEGEVVEVIREVPESLGLPEAVVVRLAVFDCVIDFVFVPEVVEVFDTGGLNDIVDETLGVFVRIFVKVAEEDSDERLETAIVEDVLALGVFAAVPRAVNVMVLDGRKLAGILGEIDELRVPYFVGDEEPLIV